MRLKLLLITLIAVPLVAVAQEQHHNNVVFYNGGKMYVGVSNDLKAKEGTANNADAYTTKDIRLYVGGSVKVVDGSAIKQRGGTALTGDLIVSDAGSAFVDNLLDLAASPSDYTTSTGTNLFRNNAIYFVNDTLQYNGANNTEIAYRAGSGTAVEFKQGTGMALKQYIRRDTPMTGTADKNTNVLNLPNIIVGDRDKTGAKSYVIVEKDIAMTVPYVVVEPGSMFSVESKPVNESGNANWAIGQNTGSFPSLMTAHIKWSHKGLAFDDEIKTLQSTLGNSFVEGGYGVARKILTNSGAPNTWAWSYAQHDLELYTPTKPENNLRSGAGIDGAVKSLNYLYPFAPLMNNLRADHMFFNILYHPATGDVTKFDDPIIDPRAVVENTAYIAVDLTNSDYDRIEDKPENNGVVREDRAVGKYQFSRKFLGARDNFDLFKETLSSVANLTADSKNPYITEVINSKGVNDAYDFPMDNSDLYGRFRLIGNRSFLPLDLSSLTAVSTSGTLTGMTMYNSSTPGTQVNVSVNATSKDTHLRNIFWIPYNSVIYADKNPGSQPAGGPQTPTVYYYYVDYFEAASVGGTATLTGEDFTLAPMQLALVQIGNQAKNYDRISLKSGLFKHANSTTVKSSEPTNVRQDELLLQIINDETGKEDRTTVVLRATANLDSSDTYDVEKQSVIADTKVGIGASELTKTTEADLQSMSEGTIFTKASSGARMSTNIIPSSTIQLPLYIVPPVASRSEFTITPYRLETMQTVNEVWLEDKYTNVFTLLTPETKYKFQADPLVGDEAEKNRFVLHFGKLAKDETIIGDLDSDISCYYNSSTLYIRGLNSKDIGSEVHIFDMQGRLMGKTKIANVPVETYLKPLVPGAYIVKISGTRNYTTKLINLQN